MNLWDRILPQPLLSLAVAFLWLALAPAVGIGSLILAALLGLTVPWATRAFWPDPPRLVRPLAGLRLFLVVLFDIVVANWQVARLVVGPLERLHPRFVAVPLDIEDPFLATILGSIVSLTPGTVSIDIDRAGARLLVHALNVEDEDKLIAAIKSRYEAPLKEMFRC
jgi:multicomponent K+:H+ antiporter subunit E